jgi:16S rRNA (uracil1498-N3)-methyltransferase
MHIFFQPNIESDSFLSEEESKHAIRVLRMKINDEIIVYDGKGNIFNCLIESIKGKKIEVQLLKKDSSENINDFYLHLAICPTKSISRFEWFLEKATEIGVDEITPLLCEHSERKTIKHERLERILVSAVKQSKNPFLPKLNKLTPYNDFIESNIDDQKFIAHCMTNDLISLKSSYKKNNNAIIMIGPEGDFSKTEVDKAKQNDFQEINLGPSRLRTETAGIVACHTINFINQ